MWHTKMHFPAKCNSGRIAIQWFHIKHYSDYQYTKLQSYTFRVQKMCVFARYATLVPRLISTKHYIKSHLELQREITLIELAPSPYFFVSSICLAYMNMFARFDENPAMPLRVIKEKALY